MTLRGKIINVSDTTLELNKFYHHAYNSVFTRKRIRERISYPVYKKQIYDMSDNYFVKKRMKKKLNSIRKIRHDSLLAERNERYRKYYKRHK